MSEAPDFKHLPSDLLNIRRMSSEEGVPMSTLRTWIYQTKELTTYRIPDRPHTVMISRARVNRLQDLKQRTTKRKVAARKGRIAITTDPLLTSQLKEAADILAGDLRISEGITVTDTIRLLVSRFLATKKK